MKVKYKCLRNKGVTRWGRGRREGGGWGSNTLLAAYTHMKMEVMEPTTTYSEDI